MIFEIINDSARAYQGVIPDEVWHEPYMSMSALQSEIANGIRSYGCEMDGRLAGVMGIQDVKDVTLIRHAYVRTECRGQRIGRSLLQHMDHLTQRPILIGAWKAARWAIAFYQVNGFVLVGEEEKKTRIGCSRSTGQSRIARSNTRSCWRADERGRHAAGLSKDS